MSTNNVLQYCKYYHHEPINPYNLSVAAYLWQIEKEWIEEMQLEDRVSGRLSLSLNHYIASGYADFEKLDDTPITLKAMLFTLLEKWNEGIVTRDDFSLFYTKWNDHEF